MMDEKKEVSREVREGLLYRARKMRVEPTEAEAALWKHLRRKQLDGLKFRRQHVIGAYIADFYCSQGKVVIELDGSVHEGQEEYDRKREDDLVAMGYRVIRFRNVEVEQDLEAVLVKIAKICGK